MAYSRVLAEYPDIQVYYPYHGITTGNRGLTMESPITENMITRERLRLELELALGRKLPTSTLYRWLDKTCIGAKRRYSQSDFEQLLIFGETLKTDHSIDFALETLANYLKEKHGHTNQSTTTGISGHHHITIDCPAETARA